MANGPEVDLGWVRHLYELVEKEVPLGKFIAPAILTAGVLWGAWYVFSLVYKDIAEPLVGAATTAGESFVGFSRETVFSMAVTTVVVGAVYGVFHWRLKKFQGHLIDELRDELDSRAEASVKPTSVSAIETRLLKVEQQLGLAPKRRSLETVFEQPEPNQFDPLITALVTGNSDLRVEAARYGWGDKWSNVTMEVQALVSDNKLEFKVDNTNLKRRKENDPAPDQPKLLEVTYSIGSFMQPKKTFREKEICRIP